MTPTRHPRVREIDFRRPSKFNREQVRRIEVAHENFCQSASSRMSAELRTELQIGLLNTDQLPYGVVMAEEVPRQALVTMLRVEPLETELALIMDLPFALALVARLLGGHGGPSGQPTSLTDVELSVARRAVSSLVNALSATWNDLADVTLRPDGNAISPMTVQIVSPSEPTLLVNLSAQVDGLMSIITLVIPHSAIERIIPKLEQGGHYGPTQVDDASSAAMHDAVGDVDMELRAEVGAVDLPLSEVLGLRAGDVVRLRRPAAKGVVLYAGDVAAHVGDPGRNGNARAVQIRQPWGGVA
ncbi:MAG TPA: FliM/FliN family flagellar motor switch protein [Thermoleophilaceae bacterium]|jgi:flagellar motor switch protein FliM